MPEMEIEQVRQHGSSTDRNYTISKDGSCIWVSGESILVKDENGKHYIVKILQNIHEQKLLEKFLKETQEFSESVVRSIDNALIVVDTVGKILKVNNAFYSLFQINQETVEGLNLAGLNHNFLSTAQLKQNIDSVVETIPFNETELEWEVTNGSKKNLSIKASFLDGKLVDKRILLVITDITEKIQLEQRKDDLIAFVIHELRNPLGNITLCNKLLEEAFEEGDKQAVQELLLRVKTNTARINSLISEMFDATKAGAGNLQYSKTLFNIDELLQEVIDATHLSVSTHKIKKGGESSVEVFADKNRMHQVFSNYLINAIKYSPDANKVDVHVSVESGNIIVAVTDYGSGIPQDKIPHVFNRYYRAEPNAKTEGLGLGLFLCKQIIDAHNGRVWIKSKIDEGSTFYFSIPVRAGT